jgi:GntR family transcriptional regulator
MLPFRLKLLPGDPIYLQIVRAVKQAVATGQLGPGDRFPAVRTIAQELGVNPNTVQKAVAELTALGLIEVHPGQGCYVAVRAPVRRDAQAAALLPLVQQLLIESRNLGMAHDDLLELLQREHTKLDEPRH